MKRPDWQLSRNGLFWVLFAFGAVIALHLDHLPAWITALAVACIGWRILEYRGAVPFPPGPLKALLVAGCVAGLALTYPSLLALEPMLSMLVAGFGLKLLEMHHKRDAVVLVYVAFFAAAMGPVFSQDIPGFIGVLLVCAVAAAALLGSEPGSVSRARSFRSPQRSRLRRLPALATGPLGAGAQAGLQGFHQVHDLVFRLRLRRSRDLLPLDLHLDQGHDLLGNLVLVLVGLERVRRGLLDELERTEP